MHRGIVHNPGKSPGFIIMLPHSDDQEKDPVWIRFDNGQENKWEQFTWVEIINEPDKYDATELYKKDEFKKLGNGPSTEPDSEWIDLGLRGQNLYNRILVSDEIDPWPVTEIAE